jgi:hypothetical protein
MLSSTTGATLRSATTVMVERKPAAVKKLRNTVKPPTTVEDG